MGARRNGAIGNNGALLRLARGQATRHTVDVKFCNCAAQLRVLSVQPRIVRVPALNRAVGNLPPDVQRPGRPSYRVQLGTANEYADAAT